MLLSIEVSLYCPRFVVLDIVDGRLKIIHAVVNDHQRESSMAMRNRTPTGTLLSEISEKLSFILTAYPITSTVWSLRQFGVANLDAAKIALGAIILTLDQHGIRSEEMLRSRVNLLLTGSSHGNSKALKEALDRLLPNYESAYACPLMTGLAWFCQHHYVNVLNWRESHAETP